MLRGSKPCSSAGQPNNKGLQKSDAGLDHHRKTIEKRRDSRADSPFLCYSSRPMKPARFRYVRAETAEHAVELLGGADPSAKILAGGQSLVPALSSRTVATSLLVDIMRCPGLADLSQSQDEITIGAACRQSRIELSPQVRQSVPLLSEALTWVAMPQVRSRGTVVGCLAQANAGGEVPVVSLALDARLNLLLGDGRRQQVAARNVYAVDSGAKLPGSSLIESASFRAQAAGEGWGFCEIQLRQGHFALVCCAATLRLDEHGRIQSARIAIGGLTANPYRADRAEAALTGETVGDSIFADAARLAADERPWAARADLHATAAFRSKVAVTTVVRALTSARIRFSARAGGTNAGT